MITVDQLLCFRDADRDCVCRVLNQQLRMAAKNTAAIVDLLDRNPGSLHFRLSELCIDTTERLDHAYLHRLFAAGMDRKRCDHLERRPCQARVQHGPACERLPAYPLRSLRHRRQATEWGRRGAYNVLLPH